MPAPSASSCAASAWSSPDGKDADFLDTTFACGCGQDAFNTYQERRSLENSAGYWQTTQCAKPDFQATSVAGAPGCRGTVGNIMCTTYDAARANYERKQQILASMVEHMSVPDAVSDYFADGMDLDEAYKAAGVSMPLDGLACTSDAPAGSDPVPRAKHGGMVKCGKSFMRQAAANNSTVRFGMNAAMAYKNGRVVSSIDECAAPVYTNGRMAKTADPSASGAHGYARGGGFNSAPVAVSCTKDMYKQSHVSLDTSFSK